MQVFFYALVEQSAITQDLISKKKEFKINEHKNTEEELSEEERVKKGCISQFFPFYGFII